jgi:predicted metalloprotease with PDZ domain
MHYKLSINAPNQQFISISVTLSSPNQSVRLQLPSWRPGRYELGNFAKNIKSLMAFDAKGKSVSFRKLNKDLWEFDARHTESITVNYKYYAKDLNAGSTYLDMTQLYVNPVNCCLYEPDSMDVPITVELEIPEDWTIASPILKGKKTLEASSFDQLADSPFICSSQLQHETYTCRGVKFHIWFNGLIFPEWKRLITDFTKFTEKQLEKFLEFPTEEYHFLIQILPYPAYHGVEHEQCTVITLGPSYEVFGKLYKELLGVSSHELYHTWNVKTIRPADMVPYDFSKENYTDMGYLTEGVTTYMGDLMLYKSNVFTLEQYLDELSNQFQKHFDNFGRFNYSVAESSFDTWLDGYQAGVPGRKVSIYTEGCLIAFITDVLLMKATDNNRKLDEVMRALYHSFGRDKIGLSEADYVAAIENVGGTSFGWLFQDYVHGTKAYEGLLVDCLDHLGLELKQSPSEDFVAYFLGVKCIPVNGRPQVMAVFPGCGFEVVGGMIGDEIVAINDVAVTANDVAGWMKFFQHQSFALTLIRAGRLIRLLIPEMNRTYYSKYSVVKQPKPIKTQIDALARYKL